MNKKILLLVVILLIVLGAIYALLNMTPKDLDVTPPAVSEIKGQIYSIEGDRILVAEGLDGDVYDGDIEKFYGNAFWFSITEETDILYSDTKLELNELSIGDEVEVWSTGFILESYPAQATASKVVMAERVEKVVACYVGGCSAELCSPELDAISTCEYLPGANCLQYASCELVDGDCQWVLSEQSAQCLLDTKEEYGEEAIQTRLKRVFEKAEEFFN